MNYANYEFRTCYYGPFDKGCGFRLIRFIKHILLHNGTVIITCTHDLPISHPKLRALRFKIKNHTRLLGRLSFCYKLLTSIPPMGVVKVRHFAFDAHNVFYLALIEKWKMTRATLYVRGQHAAHLALQDLAKIDSTFCSAISSLGILLSRKLVYNSIHSSKSAGRWPRVKPSTVIPNDIPSVERSSPSNRRTSSANKLVIGMCGQFIPRKNFLYPVKQLTPLLKQGTVKILLQGRGVEKALYEDYIKEQHLESSVELRDWVSDVGPFFQSIDVLLVPSLFDDCPNVVLEALAYGKCVLGSTNTGVAEILSHSEELTFSLTDDGVSLREKVKKMVSAPSCLEAMTYCCERLSSSRCFDWERRMIDELRLQ